MEIKYQKGLAHQQRAVDDIVKIFENVNIEKPKQLYENPQIDLSDANLVVNIKCIQDDSDNNVYAENKKQTISVECLNLDIKMETGTGKTYVYTHTVYELHKQYRFNKFIIVVPSLAIKEGAKSFIGDTDVIRHFSNTCGYNAEIDLCVLNASKQKKGKKMFPSAVREFVSGSHQNTNRIYVLLLNMGLLSDRKDGMLSRDDYDQTIQGFYKPYESLQGTRPIVIIDEPHRFSRDQKAFSILLNNIKPQCIIRFGATFPNITTRNGKSREIKKDYENLLYNLNACSAFNQNLIKGVAKEHFESPSKRTEKIRIVSIDSKVSVTLNHITASRNSQHILHKGDSLGSLSGDMSGLNINNIGKDFVEFSNGQIKRKGEEFDVNINSVSYQEAMMSLALQRHFEAEKDNFNRSQKIKTLALFFINDIQSYRGDENGCNAWLKESFERLLKDRIDKELQEDNSEEYKSFLNASLNSIQECSAGYFAQDNSDSDEAVAKEVDDILRNKKKLLSFKNENGDWNLRRFLFSKWTLKEGWDNPNVFTITKLRSSGSETSKIQEVGRGLRLPVDEYGNRVNNNEDFMLNYIVDFTEADFADKLVSEINADTSMTENSLSISNELLQNVASQRGTDSKTLYVELLGKGYVGIDKEIIESNISAFYSEYPEFNTGVGNSKIINRNNKATNTITVRKAQFEELRQLWNIINQKYVLFFEKELNNKIENEFHLTKGTFEFVSIDSKRSVVETFDNKANIEESAGEQYKISGKYIPYNEFLFRINRSTSLPIRLIHSKVDEYFNTYKESFTDGLINETSMSSFISQFNDWKIENIKGLLKYKKAKYSTKETALTDVNGKLKTYITQGLIGIKSDNGKPSAKYLYDSIAYDSPLEKSNILTDIEEVVVYGKIPRRSISIPTIIDNYSPDFMYVIKRKDGRKELNIVVETKDVEGKSQLRPTEQAKIDCAKLFFSQLKEDGYDVKFETQIQNRTLSAIINDLIN